MPAVLSRFGFPSLDVCPHTELYVRPAAGAAYSPTDRSLRLGPGASAGFETYFNAFSVGKWRAHSSVETVSAVVDVRGECRLDLVHSRRGGRRRVVASRMVSATVSAPASLALPSLSELGDGNASVEVVCTGGEAVVHAGRWETFDVAQRVVRLGLVITTFNRNAFVRDNVRRLLAMLEREPREDLRVIVVDNGRNLDLDLPTGAPVTVLPNPNVGGAGGFARGLMELRDGGWATHVLFMDDDVTFDPEITTRAQALLAYARDPNLCISGAMLNDREPTVVFEAGACFDGTAVHPLRALKGGLDLLDPEDVLAADEEGEAADYGAWWFFAFPIGLTRDNPLPMFVRGDDVCWGVQHAKGRIATCNGIGLWHQDFDAKNGPLAWFYDMRNFALVGVLAFDGYQWWHLLRRYVVLCGRSLLSFKYASAAEITFATQEFLRGPAHWMAVDAAALHERVRALDGEKLAPLDAPLLAVPDAVPRRGLAKWAGAVASLAVLGGHLLPTSWCRRPMVALHVQHRALLAAPLRTELLFRSERQGEGFVARRDRKRFFTLLADMLRTAGRIPLRFRGLARDYRAAYPDMVSDEYWRRQFGTAGNAGSPVTGPAVAAAGPTPASAAGTDPEGARPRPDRPAEPSHRSAPRT